MTSSTNYYDDMASSSNDDADFFSDFGNLVDSAGSSSSTNPSNTNVSRCSYTSTNLVIVSFLVDIVQTMSEKKK